MTGGGGGRIVGKTSVTCGPTIFLVKVEFSDLNTVMERKVMMCGSTDRQTKVRSHFTQEQY